jgi:hypothetical protein
MSDDGLKARSRYLQGLCQQQKIAEKQIWGSSAPQSLRTVSPIGTKSLRNMGSVAAHLSQEVVIPKNPHQLSKIVASDLLPRALYVRVGGEPRSLNVITPYSIPRH